MPLHEYRLGLHIHTPYSDGEWSHAQIAAAAQRAEVDVLIITDHNIWVNGPERYYTQGDQRVLLLVGEEVHDMTRQPQKNHLLIFGANQELSAYAPEPQAVIEAARAAGGLTFIAHPFEDPLPIFHEPALGWENWEVTGFTGLEIWNYMSGFKSLLTSPAHAMQYAFEPEAGIDGAPAKTLAKWDELTAAGQRVVGLGGVDAHGTAYQLGGLKRVVFPYEFLFRQLSTHLLLEAPLTGEALPDRQRVLAALAQGHAFISYDGAAPGRGFRFTASSAATPAALMGDPIKNAGGVTLQVVSPAPAHLRLMRNGTCLAHWENQTHVSHSVPPGETGVFRVEARLKFHGRPRGWIYSNPIYVEV